MELNMISAGIELLGITVKELEVHNQIVDAEMDAKRVFGLNICEPEFQLDDDTKEIYAEIHNKAVNKAIFVKRLVSIITSN